MRSYLIGIGMVGATALLVLAGSAKAEPSKVGEAFVGNGFLCDTEAQVKTLFDAAQDPTGAKLTDAYLKLNDEKNADGFPACVYGDGTGVTVLKVENLGHAWGNTGLAFNAWMVSIVGSHDIHGVIMYGEMIREAPQEAPKS
jgi:hypothetical protein